MSVVPNKLMSKVYQTGKTVTDVLSDILDTQSAVPRLQTAATDALLSGGKRIRPFLVVESAKLFGVHDPRILRVAGAVECVHCYSLVHDDLPAMDNDDIRRGQPTLHKKYDDATAILVGDGLLTLAFEILSDHKTHKDAQIRANLCLALARASGLNGMVGGQMLDIMAETSTLAVSEDTIRHIQSLKTGYLINTAIHMGAILGGATPQHMQALHNYGAAIGLAFQISDDLLDALGDSVVIGKKVRKDSHRNKATFVSLLGIQPAQQMCLDMIDTAKQALIPFGADAQTLCDLADFIYMRNK